MKNFKIQDLDKMINVLETKYNSILGNLDHSIVDSKKLNRYDNVFRERLLDFTLSRAWVHLENAEKRRVNGCSFNVKSSKSTVH